MKTEQVHLLPLFLFFFLFLFPVYHSQYPFHYLSLSLTLSLPTGVRMRRSWVMSLAALLRLDRKSFSWIHYRTSGYCFGWTENASLVHCHLVPYLPVHVPYACALFMNLITCSLAIRCLTAAVAKSYCCHPLSPALPLPHRYQYHCDLVISYVLYFLLCGW